MAGAWSVRARWAGDADREGFEGAPVLFSVEAPPPPKQFWEEVPGGAMGLSAAVLIALAILIAALVLRGRIRGGAGPAPAAPPQSTPTDAGRCPSCGAEYPEGSAFCPKCGGKLQ